MVFFFSFFYLRNTVFDQKCPVHPVSEFMWNPTDGRTQPTDGLTEDNLLSEGQPFSFCLILLSFGHCLKRGGGGHVQSFKINIKLLKKIIFHLLT